MDFRIADTFTDSLARLTGDEQKAVKTTAFDLQLDRGVELFEYSCQQANYAIELMVGGERSSVDRSSPIVP